MPTQIISWKNSNINADGINVYRSKEPMDINNMPSPIATLGPDIGSYNDTTVVEEITYYYRLGITHDSGSEDISNEYIADPNDFRFISFNSDNEMLILGANGHIVGSIETLIPSDAYRFLIDSQSNGYYITSDQTELKKINTNNDISWTFTGSEIHVIVLDSKEEYIYISDVTDNKIRKINTTTGTEVVTINQRSYRTPAIDSSGNIYAVDGKYAYKFDSGGQQQWSSYQNDYPDMIFLNSKEEVFIASDDLGLMKLNRENGNEIWSIGINNSYGIATDNNGYIYFTKDESRYSDTRLYEVDSTKDIESYREIIEDSSLDTFYQMIADDYGYLYFFGNNGVSKVRKEDGTIVWKDRKHTFSETTFKIRKLPSGLK